MARRRGRGKRIDYRQWTGTATALSGVDNAGVVATGTIATVTVPATLLRVRGVLGLAADHASPADGDKLLVAAGIIVREESATGGPSPLSDPEADWLWHGYFVYQQEGSVVWQASSDLAGASGFAVDSKAMRRLTPGDFVQLRIDGQQVSGSPTYSYTAGLRILIGT